jgi:hypothetical protein
MAGERGHAGQDVTPLVGLLEFIAKRMLKSMIRR